MKEKLRMTKFIINERKITDDTLQGIYIIF